MFPLLLNIFTSFNSLLELVNFLVSLGYVIVVFFLIIFYEMLIHFDASQGFNAIAKAIQAVAFKDSSFIPTVSGQQSHKTIQAMLFKFDSIFKILINVNRGLLYGVFFMLILQAISPTLADAALFINTVSTIIEYEAIAFLPMAFSLLIFDKLADVINLAVSITR